MEGSSRAAGVNDEETSSISCPDLWKGRSGCSMVVGTGWTEGNLLKSYYMKPVGENSGLHSSNNRMYWQNVVWQSLLVSAAN